MRKRSAVIVDDQKRMRELLELTLEEHYECILFDTGLDAIHYVKNNQCDVVLLDVMMPGLTGWEICQQLRDVSDVPIVMITARTETEDIVKGLRLGADDYVTKPFKEEELLARMEAVQRRKKMQTTQEQIGKGLQLDELSHTVAYNGQLIPVTHKEFELLQLFIQHPNQVLKREQLITRAWGYSTFTDDRTVDSHIRNLREKLRHVGFPVAETLLTVWGVGYRWVPHQ
ncbi:response regulator transcription factor [Bacillus fonticola]|uniref:response regulator transcription factor n=1 Tax=Bacillus fonticola TaxID=2728853 RepID=UPI0014731DD5|nr:response regulator transcription factor [Bacillus fonticola]